MNNLEKDNARDFYKYYKNQKIEELKLKEDEENNLVNEKILRKKIEEDIVNNLEKALKEYLKNKPTNKTQRDKMKLKMFKLLSELDVVYDVFVKKRLGGLKEVNSIDKNIYFFDDEEFFSAQLEKCLKRIEKVYEEKGEILSLKQEFNKIYFYRIQDVFLKKMEKKNLMGDIDKEKGEKARNLIREIVELLYIDDKNFLKEAKKEINKIKGNNRQKAQDSLMNIFISRISSVGQNEQTQENLVLLKEACIKLLNILYPVDVDKEDEHSNKYFRGKIKNLKYISNQALQDIFVNIDVIEKHIIAVKDIFKNTYIVNNEQIGKDGKIIYLSEQEDIADLNKSKKERAEERLIEFTDKINEILYVFKRETGNKSLISFIESAISIYIIKHYDLYGDIPLEVKNFIDNDLDEYNDFKQFYNTLSKYEQEEEKPDVVISAYLDKKYDTVRKYPNMISNKIKEEKYAIRLLAITQGQYNIF
ncbi:hypothetical protein [Megamonas funiformis]|uniref:hypothetical protein n=1 Tax=Megamonas funiformis TaxID=437897 RepID=UPI00195D550B|nr:hypothetical protein [Megamonas funiformis]MBM6727376.1 hypothetical protein [Megamonas funiformis]